MVLGYNSRQNGDVHTGSLRFTTIPSTTKVTGGAKLNEGTYNRSQSYTATVASLQFVINIWALGNMPELKTAGAFQLHLSPTLERTWNTGPQLTK